MHLVKDEFMLKPLFNILLLPVILLQGMYVKKVTPRLPEARGERSGFTSASQQMSEEISILIIGDSAAAGVGVDHQDQALLGHIIKNLPEKNLRWQLLACTGDTSAQLLQRASAFHQLDKDRDFHHVVISVGVNDVTGSTSVKRWKDNLTRLIHQLEHDFNSQKIYFSALPPMHSFPALPQPLRWFLGRRAKVLNKVLKQVANKHNHCVMVEAAFPLSPEFIADDGFHPGAAAYQIWGSHVAQLVKTEIVS